MEYEAIRERVFAAKDSRDGRARKKAELGFLPIRVGDGEVAGIVFTTIVPDARDKGPDATAELVIKRLEMIPGRHRRKPEPITPPAAYKPEPLTPPDIEIKHIDSFEANKDTIKAALTLYERQIPEDEQVDLENLIHLIRRYLSGYYAPRFLLHFFVAIFGRQVVGMLMCYEDTEANFAFVPYAAALKPLRGARNPQHITRELGIGLMNLRRRLNLPPLRLLFEANDPRLAEGKERGLRESRIKLFDSLGAPYEGLRLRALDLRYLQPRLEWPGEGREKEILLFIATPGLPATLTQKEAIEILKWTYTELYSGKIFDEDPPLRAEFRKYTRGLFDSIVPTLPESIRLLRCRDLI